MKRLSIRARMTIWYTGILAATVLVLGGVAFGLLMRGLWNDVDSTLERVAKAAAQAAQQTATEFVPPDMNELLRRYFGSNFADRFYQFLDPRGEVDPRLPRERGAPLTISPQALKNATEGYGTFETLPNGKQHPLRVFTFPIVVHGRMVNVLQVGMSLEGLLRERQNFLWALATLTPLGLILAGGGGWLLARRVLRPVDQMTQAARRIGAEHLAERLAGAETDDELGRLARTLNEMLARLEAGFAQIRRFSADASHELRTPLTILKGEIEVALRSAREPAEYERVLSSALEEVERMARLVDDLLMLSRADAGALRWEKGPVDLDRLVEDVAKQGEVLGRGRAIRVSIESLEPLIAHGDEPRLRQLLLNLVDNAVKYTPQGGRVTLSLRQAKSGSSEQAVQQPARSLDPPIPSAPAPSPSEWAEIAVTDTGAGIPPEALPRIFERFYRVDDARSREAGGTGLGLCIARTIAEAHEGRIGVESVPGVGSTFTVRLPLAT
jgi:two-component system OmpR family sensor kinase